MTSEKEALLWSIALPGFGQFLTGKYLKGIVIIALEFIINVQGNFNKVIIYSFQGDIEVAIEQANYQWLMFYPCLYFFAMWDAYKDAGGGKTPFEFLPFVFSGYFVTFGLVVSPVFNMMGILFGPVWLPMLFVIPGITVGIIIKVIIMNVSHSIH